ncbi:hypothetical protein [Candidatus Albibeggiatoa sp. nov. BB20]|uniref:hypothetical protein n=1 Tax=Candidatus Albibeggiatoa sp. nov. BB20 TaxID=3162723 RepID=UPI003365408C
MSDIKKTNQISQAVDDETRPNSTQQVIEQKRSTSKLSTGLSVLWDLICILDAIVQVIVLISQVISFIIHSIKRVIRVIISPFYK